MACRHDVKPASSNRPSFTLVELIVVILIVAILAGIVTPRLLDKADAAKAATIVSTIRVIFSAADRYAADNGQYPADTSYGATPVDLEPYMLTSVFSQKNGLGGYYDWNGPSTGAPTIGVGIRVSSWSDSGVQRVYQAIEESVDDGNPTTGWVTTTALGVNFKLADK